MQHRRFVNLVVDTFVGGRTAYALHRIDVSGLFIHRGSPGAIDEDKALLPPPAMTFYPTGSVVVGNVDFLPLSGSEGEDVVALGHDGLGLLYGAASRAVHVLPALHRHKGSVNPISLAAANNLYVIERRPFYTDACCFAVLSHGIRPGGWSCDDFPRHGRSPGWYWRSLPPPPFAYASNHDCYTTCRPARARGYGITACAAASDGTELWMTLAQGGGTYSFHTASSAWRKAGNWALPFRGRAAYVPEHRLWFGLSSGWDRLLYLCASDLTGALGRPLRVWKWAAGLPPPSEEWSPAEESYLLPLGCGKFCVARFFEDHQGWHSCAVFTGVEVTKDDRTSGFRMLKHQSKRYTFLDQDFRKCFGRVF
ncbi:unnamed protein product [Urochloa humidicola]